MDIQPVNAGHLLVIPNQHYPDLASLPPEIGSHLFLIGQKMTAGIYKSDILCEGVNFFLADGTAAGQDVFHVHLHVIPRYEGDGFGFVFDPSYSELSPRDELDRNAALIREAVKYK
jgi:histidine triad (HIT) family protein